MSVVLDEERDIEALAKLEASKRKLKDGMDDDEDDNDNTAAPLDPLLPDLKPGGIARAGLAHRLFVC